MNSAAPADRFQNPFSTRYVRPGAMPYLLAGEDQTVSGVMALWQQAGWRGQIIGPHGSGKSTLIAALVSETQRLGMRSVVIALRDGQRRLGVTLRRMALPAGPARVAIVVDGYEQLAWCHRAWLRWLCGRRGWGLLVTAHRPVGLPLLAQTRPSEELAERIVRQLLPEDDVIRRADVLERYTLRQGNLREMLFDLYDLYEARRRAGGRPATRD